MLPPLLELLDQDAASQLWVTYHDYSGLSHAKSVPAERFASAVDRGIGFAKANMDFNVLDQQVPHPVFGAETGDFFAVPDPDAYALIPYRRGTARAFSFLHLSDGSRWDGCPRTALQHQVERYQAAGLTVQVAFEPEFYLFKRTVEGYAPADNSRMFTVDGLEIHHQLLTRLSETLTAMGVIVEQTGAEYGPAQYEVNIRHTSPLRAADDLLTLKEATRALAREAGLIASFMPKPYTNLPGCGLHVHLGLIGSEGGNALEGDLELGLSTVGRNFIAGLLEHASALSGIGAPTVNSYQRLLPGSWSPAHVSYGAGNRSALVRIPDAGSRHIEFRVGDNTSNPHLFLAAILAAGWDGINRCLDPGAPVTEDIGHLGEDEAATQEIRFLPRQPSDALDAVAADCVVRDALGPVIGPTFLRVKRSEVAMYQLDVSDWERSAYLETI